MKHKKRWFFIIGFIITIIPVGIGITVYNKKLPTNISMESATFQTDNVQFLYDVTYEQNNERVMEQQLFNQAVELINEAEQFLVVDMFLYNDDYDRAKGGYPNSAEQITEALIAKRQQNPDMQITVITDKMNTLYLSNKNPFFEKLTEHNIEVALTDMKALRDSNPLYSSIWRAYFQWWKPSENGFLPNAFNPDGGKASIGSYLDLLNFKANHRKIIMNEQRAMLTSANLTHDGSSFHSNIGFIVEGEILKALYQSEQAVAKLANVELKHVEFTKSASAGDLEITLLTEGKIKKAMLQLLHEATENDRIKIGVFYIADRDIVEAMEEAAERGAKIQMILDPNKDAFGIEKNGIPNRQVAAELIEEENIDIRWYATNGEQYHSKFLFVEKQDKAFMIGGSANFTRRNLADYNLESNLLISMPLTHSLSAEVNSYFNRLWSNENGIYTVEFEAYKDETLWKKLFYQFQEFTGLSTF
ncbi:phospholipase D-like domain-containing protein [Solibacillus silvestris]|uniref:phospholipase D-like domain-containing protein n=1 Tax=Solibacillus silvestris TaxID=76853 RepID=UPI003F7E2C6F